MSKDMIEWQRENQIVSATISLQVDRATVEAALGQHLTERDFAMVVEKMAQAWMFQSAMHSGIQTIGQELGFI